MLSSAENVFDPQASGVLEVTIERILPGGVGLAHSAGRTLLVALAAPGDVARVRIDQVRGKLAFASIVEIVQPSPVRIEPPCPYFGGCGGCDFQQMNYQAQLDAKVEIIRDCLRRIARINSLPEVSVTPSPLQWHYRARANWQFDSRQKRLGYFERGSHRVCDVAECAVLSDGLQQTLGALRRQIALLPKDLRDIEAAEGDEGPTVAPPVAGFSPRPVRRRINNDNYTFAAESFFQVNHTLLASLIAEAIGNAHGEMAVDLYCGVGLFTVPLARRFANVIGVEANPLAAKFARSNLSEAQLANAKVVMERVSDWLRSNAPSPGSIAFLLLDPPRSGVEEDGIKQINEFRPKQIAYVSCDPATLARDLKALITAGYSLQSVAAFDMFPQTHHVETVVHLAC